MALIPGSSLEPPGVECPLVRLAPLFPEKDCSKGLGSVVKES